MHRLSRVAPASEAVAKELPNWGIRALYGDRQLMRKKKMTKYFIPFDTAQPDDSWRLFVFNSDGSETVISLDIESTMIGRESYCDVRLRDRSVSRQHCVIQFRSVQLDENSTKRETIPYVFDLGSKCGTSINDDQIQSRCFVELKPKDQISIGNESAVIMRVK